MSPYKCVGIFFFSGFGYEFKHIATLWNLLFFFFCLGLLMWAGCGQPVGSETDDPAAPGSMHS